MADRDPGRLDVPDALQGVTLPGPTDDANYASLASALSAFSRAFGEAIRPAMSEAGKILSGLAKGLTLTYDVFLVGDGWEWQGTATGHTHALTPREWPERLTGIGSRCLLLATLPAGDAVQSTVGVYRAELTQGINPIRKLLQDQAWTVTRPEPVPPDVARWEWKLFTSDDPLPGLLAYQDWLAERGMDWRAERLRLSTRGRLWY